MWLLFSPSHRPKEWVTSQCLERAQRCLFIVVLKVEYQKLGFDTSMSVQSIDSDIRSHRTGIKTSRHVAVKIRVELELQVHTKDVQKSHCTRLGPAFRCSRSVFRLLHYYVVIDRDLGLLTKRSTCPDGVHSVVNAACCKLFPIIEDITENLFENECGDGVRQSFMPFFGPVLEFLTIKLGSRCPSPAVPRRNWNFHNCWVC